MYCGVISDKKGGHNVGDCIVRAAKSETDLALLTALEAATFRDPWHEGELRSHLCSTTAVTLLCFDEEKRAVGYLLGACLPPEGEVFRVAVIPDARGCGIGRKIVLSFLDILDMRGADVCFLEVRESNTAARALYASLGFVPVGLRKNYYKNPTEHAIVMKRG